MGATAGRTTLMGEGLQHQDGHSLVLASTVPAVQAYDPAFAYEVGAIVRAGMKRMYGGGTPDGPMSSTTSPCTTRTTRCQSSPTARASPKQIVEGLYKCGDAPEVEA